MILKMIMIAFIKLDQLDELQLELIKHDLSLLKAFYCVSHSQLALQDPTLGWGSFNQWVVSSNLT